MQYGMAHIQTIYNIKETNYIVKITQKCLQHIIRCHAPQIKHKKYKLGVESAADGLSECCLFMESYIVFHMGKKLNSNMYSDERSLAIIFRKYPRNKVNFTLL